MSFALSKLLWMIANPTHVLVFAACFGFWRYGATNAKSWAALAWLALAAIVFAGVLPVGHWLLIPLEDRFPRPSTTPQEISGIIILGGAQVQSVTADRDVLAVNQYAERLIEGLSLAKQYPDAKVVFTGGSGKLLGDKPSEALVNAKFLELLPLQPERVFMETQSRNTFENAIYTKQLMEPNSGDVWLLVTSAFHMPRSVGIFRAIGWNVTPWPVDYQTTGRFEWEPGIDIAAGLHNLNVATREMIGLAAYWFMGRTSALFPAP